MLQCLSAPPCHAQGTAKHQPAATARATRPPPSPPPKHRHSISRAIAAATAAAIAAALAPPPSLLPPLPPPPPSPLAHLELVVHGLAVLHGDDALEPDLRTWRAWRGSVRTTAHGARARRRRRRAVTRRLRSRQKMRVRERMRSKQVDNTARPNAREFVVAIAAARRFPPPLQRCMTAVAAPRHCTGARQRPALPPLHDNRRSLPATMAAATASRHCMSAALHRAPATTEERHGSSHSAPRHYGSSVAARAPSPWRTRSWRRWSARCWRRWWPRRSRPPWTRSCASCATGPAGIHARMGHGGRELS